MTIIQRSAEWYAIRLGKVTSSRIADVVAKTKSGWGASRANYAAFLIAERLTGVPGENYVSPAMQHGIDCEPEARALYEFMRDVTVVESGFEEHPSISMAGASLDGLVGEQGLLEIKCPNTATHIETLLGAPIDEKYIKQIQWQFACRPERKWCDWISYDPQMPEPVRLHVRNVKRDDVMIGELQWEVTEFLKELDDKLDQLRRRYPALGDGAPAPSLREQLVQSIIAAG